ncbi:MAG: cobalamin synthesis protein [Bacteroidetes bacterium]|nr:cobalamin synthesis protein [Bacteroidota bacterium]
MKLVTVSGPPSSGKTSVLLKLIGLLKQEGSASGVIKFDCLYANEPVLFEKLNVPVVVGLSGNLCPDHFFVSNIQEGVNWGLSQNLDYLFTESAGLCNRCSPHIRRILAICVIDNLMGIETPKKIGPMLRMADIVVISKSDIVSQAEREVFSFRVRQANPKAKVFFVNGITGQGVFQLARMIDNANDTVTVQDNHLRFSMPAALCSYCLGETAIGGDYQVGNLRKIDFHKNKPLSNTQP